MAYAPNQRHVEMAFSSQSLRQHGKRVEFQCREIGHLLVTSGALAASDPDCLGAGKTRAASVSERNESASHDRT